MGAALVFACGCGVFDLGMRPLAGLPPARSASAPPAPQRSARGDGVQMVEAAEDRVEGLLAQTCSDPQVVDRQLVTAKQCDPVREFRSPLSAPRCIDETHVRVFFHCGAQHD